MKKLFFSTLALIILSIGASAQTTAKAKPAKTTSITTTTNTNPAGTTTMEKTTTATKGTTATKPRHKRHFVQKKKTTAATK